MAKCWFNIESEETQKDNRQGKDKKEDKKKVLKWSQENADWLILMTYPPVKDYLRNHIHCTFILNFFVSLFLKRFLDFVYKYKLSLNRSTWHIDRTLKDTIISDQSGSGSNCNEVVLLRVPKMEPQH